MSTWIVDLNNRILNLDRVDLIQIEGADHLTPIDVDLFAVAAYTSAEGYELFVGEKKAVEEYFDALKRRMGVVR